MDAAPNQERIAALSLAALGVVYGDIGTSPLYAIKEVFGSAHNPVPITPENVLGILSLIFWSLIAVVSLKYVTLILRADNRGEGGVMALMALVLGNKNRSPRVRSLILTLGLIGAALFYGDGVITPAISVLSAVEGLEVATPALKPYVVPITVAILIGLFAVQRHGTARVGVVFGPVTAVWFLAIGALGVMQIVRQPNVLLALWPGYALGFLAANPGLGFLSLSAVFLAVTGAEALYADMGHFGRLPIRLAWFVIVLPSLLLNYFGQGALLLANSSAIENPFYRMAPDWALYPLVALATAATVIASQAVISGAYSITQQAIQLGYAPRMDIRHTSSATVGQIYLPGINWALLGSVIALVLGFQSSTRLAAAYGIAVTGTMIITTVFAYLVSRDQWRWGAARAMTIFGLLLLIDLAFLAANAVKIHDGGWFSLVFGFAVFILLTTWKQGRDALNSRLDSEAVRLPEFISAIERSEHIATVNGASVFMTPRYESVPHALLHNLKHNQVLHQKVVLVTVLVLAVPRVKNTERVLVERLSERFYRAKIYFGFMEEADVPSALEWCEEQGLDLDPNQISYFLGRESLVPTIDSATPIWRQKLFAALFRNAGSAAAYFKLPPNRVIELGAQVAL